MPPKYYASDWLKCLDTQERLAGAATGLAGARPASHAGATALLKNDASQPVLDGESALL